MILTGQITREEALEQISKSELDEETMKKDFEYVATKLDWTTKEFQEIFEGKNKSFKDYKNNFKLIKLATKIANFLGAENRLFR